jgi:hypothetical protein
LACDKTGLLWRALPWRFVAHALPSIRAAGSIEKRA